MARPKTRLTVDEFLAIIATHKGARVLSLATRTTLVMVKHHRVTGNRVDRLYPMGVERRAVGRFVLNFNYENNVNAQRVREEKPADFRADPLWVSGAHPEGAARPDGRWPRYLVQHVDTGARYMRVRPNTNRWGRVVKEHDAYFDVASGREIRGDELVDLLANCVKQPGSSRKQDLERPIPVRTYSLRGLFAAKYSGRWYTLIA